ncbi:MAG: hypothetical protein AAF502_18920 [Bacteroidota bacterium]
MKKVSVIFFWCLTTMLIMTCGSSRFVPSEDMTKLDLQIKDYVIKPGQKLYYAAKVHASVGSAVSVSVADKTIVKIGDEIFEYDNPKNAKMPGGDAATEYYIFEGVKKGATTIQIDEVFRGEIEASHSIKINVVE